MHQTDLLDGNEVADDHATHKLFFALWPDATLRTRIAAAVEQLGRTHPVGGRRTRPETYHLTLQYLGEFRPLQPSILDGARSAAAAVQLPGFDLVLDRAGGFANANVCWLGTSEPPPALQHLWDRLAELLAHARVRVKSPPAFSPHLTILRGVRTPWEPVPSIEPMHWRVREFVLVDSVSSGTHPEYGLLGRWPLQGEPRGT